MAANRYVFGAFALCPSRASLRRGDAQIALRPKAFDALQYLVENPGRIVQKDELIAAVWRDVVVTDDSLAKCIQEIREALDDRRQRYVRTVPRRGYLFDVAVAVEPTEAGHVWNAASLATAPATVASAEERALPPSLSNASSTPLSNAGPVRELTHGPRARAWLGLAAAAFSMVAVGAYYFIVDGTRDPREPQTIAVLPFLNLSSNADQEYFSDGLAEELLNKLAKLEGLRVSARTSSFTFKGSSDDVPTIAAKLGVDNVVEGSVRRDGDSIRITVQLIEGRSGTHLWSETYERELEGVFAIQDDIAESIAAELSITLGIADRDKLRSGTQSVEAFDHYLAGLALLNAFGVDETVRSIEEMERATKIDPEYADAWAVLAVAHVQDAYFVTNDFERAAVRAERAARRALVLNPNLAPAHMALAHVHVQRGEWARGEQEALKAVSIPSEFTAAWDYAEILQAAGYLEEALEYRRHAREALSFNVAPAAELAIAYHEVGDDGSAEAEIERAAGLVGDPGVLLTARLTLAMARRDDAFLRRFLEEANAAGSPTATALAKLLDDHDAAASELPRLRDMLSDDPRARARLSLWAAYFGESELAAELVSDYAVEGAFAVQIFWSPVMRDARRTRAFEDLVRELGLVDFWRVRGWPTLCRPVGGDGFECD